MLMLCIMLLSAACTAAPASVQTNTPPQPPTGTAAPPQPSRTPTPTTVPSATPTLEPSVTPTALRTPPALPDIFDPDSLPSGSVPQTYLADTCQYLKARWNPNNSAPGTVVMIVMYHSIAKDSRPLAADGSQIHASELVKTLEHAHALGFQTITTEQLADFLEHNARIPPRSLLLIVDDRKRKEYYETHFVPFLKEYHWTVTNAWISAPDTPEIYLQENREVQAQGWVDVQAHGVVHNIPASGNSTDEFLRNELQGSMEAIQKNFGARPVGYIWPGGGFTPRAVELAREAGYRVGFTTNPRGPVMFNWVPLASQTSSAHPLWLPESSVNDPLMVLPRYWSSDAAYRLDDVANIGSQAAEAAARSRETELEYYDIVCKSLTGEIPAAAP